MNLRHAAAFALVGWYLMTPSYEDTRPVSAIPLSQWDIQHVYDSANECDRVLGKWRDIVAKSNKEDRAAKEAAKSNQKFKWDALGDIPVENFFYYSSAKCIASDDPRLKEK